MFIMNIIYPFLWCIIPIVSCMYTFQCTCITCVNPIISCVVSILSFIIMLNSLRVQYNREPKINIKIKYLTQSHKKNVWANILWEWPTSHEQTKTFIYMTALQKQWAFTYISLNLQMSELNMYECIYTID